MLFDLKKEAIAMKNLPCHRNPPPPPEKQPTQTADASLIGQWAVGFITGKNLDAMRRHFDVMLMGDSIEFTTGGQWSFHHMILYWLNRLGPAEVCVTTWGLSENPVRALVMAKNAGHITRLDALLDLRIRNNQSGALALLLSACESHRLTKIHAKVATIVTPHAGVVILTSANLTENRRIEAGTIRYERESAVFHQNWIKDEIRHGRLVGKSGRGSDTE